MPGTAPKADGERVIAERMSLNGQPIDPAASYRVTVNNYLVGRRRRLHRASRTAPRAQFGIYDVDALYSLFPGQ